MIVAGLTGNYGMGKSSVATLFRDLGAYTLDSDKVVAGLLKDESVIGQVAGLLGVAVLKADGSLNKPVIAGTVFQNKALRKRLEALLHPLVLEYIDASVKRIRDKNSIVIVEVPLLFEGTFQDRFDRTITVYTNQKTALARLKKSGIARKDALARLKAQMDIRQKKKLSDFCIDNNGTKSRTAAQVRKIFQVLVNDNRVRLSSGRHQS
jgi:dephospho-CoA kinase